MTSDEYKHFMQSDVKSRLPSIYAWLVDRLFTYESGFDVLRRVDRKSARLVVAQMQDGSIAIPQPYDSFFSMVAREAANLDTGEAIREDRDGPRICEYCQGLGYVRVWALDHRRSQPVDVMVICQCRVGDRIASPMSKRGRRIRPRDIVRFDPRRMERCRYGATTLEGEQQRRKELASITEHFNPAEF